MANCADPQPIQSLTQRILVTCAAVLGGVGPLARHLDATEDQVSGWVSGKSVPSAEVVLKAVDPLLDKPRA